MILEKLEVGAYAANCYIIGDESSKEGLIIDPGAEANQISRKVKDLGLKIKYIVLTHGHMDHVGALKEMKETTHARVAIHADDAASLQARNPFTTALGHSPQTPPSPDWLISDGDKLDIGSLHFVVLHTPGHTQGGICLFGAGVVFTGDTLFNFSIGRTDLSGGSYEQIIESIRTKLMVLPDDTVVYPGHGPESTISTERRLNPFLQG
ncbi:MAG: MBL fold metallo-hydrolase [Chloroflexi bacterium]|nr:MBL fold metallo-hydrolase [Chloroflexota bacterium]